MKVQNEMQLAILYKSAFLLLSACDHMTLTTNLFTSKFCSVTYNEEYFCQLMGTNP